MKRDKVIELKCSGKACFALNVLAEQALQLQVTIYDGENLGAMENCLYSECEEQKG